MMIKKYQNLIALVVILGYCEGTTSLVLILRNDYALSLQSQEATFARPVGKYGISAYLHAGIPLDGCSSMNPAKPHPISPSPTSAISSPFALISRGGLCSLATKVQNVQEAGFTGAIIFDDDDNDAPPFQLITTVLGDDPTEEVDIYVMFVSKRAGVVLQRYTREAMPEIWVLPGMESDLIWPVIIISIVSFLAIASMSLACGLMTRSGWFSPEPCTDERLFKMRIEDVRALPIAIFTGMPNGSMTDGATCAICLEDYLHGERLRVLPCFHRFHTSCIDAWLVLWKPVCPLCRCDPRPNSLSSSETTPLLAPPQPTLQQPQPFAYGTTTEIESSPHSPPMRIPNATNSQFQSLAVPLNPQTLANNVLPLFAVSHVFEHAPLHSQADSSLEAFRTSPHFNSPLYSSTYLSPSVRL